MNIKSGEDLTVCELVTKLFHQNEDVSKNNDEEIKNNLEIAVLELGHLINDQRKDAREFLQKLE